MCLIHIMKETVVKKQKKQVENKLVIELRTKFKTAEDNDYERSPEESAGPVLTDKWIANSIFVPDDPLNAIGCREGGKNSVTLRSFFERYKQIDDGTQGDGAGRTVTLTLDETTVEFRLTGLPPTTWDDVENFAEQVLRRIENLRWELYENRYYAALREDAEHNLFAMCFVNPRPLRPKQSKREWGLD